MKFILKSIFFITSILLISCVKTDDFQTPTFEDIDLEMNSNSTINSLKNTLIQSKESIFTFSSTNEGIIEGYVISSDQSGNFYKKIIIQDQFENPTSGIEILIDKKSIYTKYNVGRKLYLKIAGLGITQSNGKFSLGIVDRNELKEIPEQLIDNYIIRSNILQEIIPKKITLNNISNEDIHTYIDLENIQFTPNELGKSFAGEIFDLYTGERILKQCENNIKISLSSSVYSSFKSTTISNENGTISAILNKDFYGEKFVLEINDISSVNLDNEGRCDPVYLDCKNEELTNNEIIFMENFDDVKNISELEKNGWINQNLNYHNTKFEKKTKSGNGVARISAYNTEENYFETWLISPKIDLSKSTNEYLSFETNASYDNGTLLEVYISNHFEGAIGKTAWIPLNVKIDVGPRNSYHDNFTYSGKIPINCIDNQVFIAFKYLGSDPSLTTTYDIDNIKIEGIKNN